MTEKLRKLLNRAIGFVGYYLGLTRFSLFLVELIRRQKILTAFTYHRVTDRSKGDVGYLIYDVGVDFRSFEAQIAAVQRYFHVVGIEAYREYVVGSKRLDRRVALLTFDDADSSFETYALPVLRKYGCKSVVFAPTDFIGSDKRFWHLRLSNLIAKVTDVGWEKIQTATDGLPTAVAQAIRDGSIVDERDRGKTCRSLAHAIDQFDAKTIDAIIAKLEAITGIAYSLGVGCLNWEQLAKIMQDGAEIESHTVSHRKLALLDEATIRRELADSRALLSEKLGRKVTAICYPAGSYNDDVLKAAEATGFELGFTTQRGLCSVGTEGRERFRLKRVSMWGDNKYQADFHLAKMMLKILLRGDSKH